MPGKYKGVLGLANHYLSYLIHENDNHGWWRTKHPNHYEELVTTSKYFGDDWGNFVFWMLGSNNRYSSRKILKIKSK
jgi:hypothetical protein